MDHHQDTLRVGAAAVACALSLRLLAGGLLDGLVGWLSRPETQSFLIYLETGRVVKIADLEEPEEPTRDSPQPQTQTVETIPPETIPEETQPAQLPCFTPSDGETVQVRYSCSYRPDISALLAKPLNWDLTTGKPTVLIIHTHTTESYTKASGETYEESGDFRTLDLDYNMVSVGDRVTQLLEAQGIRVIHDRQLHDYPSYNGSYSHARTAIREYLKAYPSICLVLDLHRDASGDLHNQMRTHATVDGRDSAQLMVVVGTSASGLSHADWEDNLSLGLKLHTQLERTAPGITRPLTLRAQRFNQDLLPGTLLIEVGAAGNSHDEAMVAAEVLASAIGALARGST